MPLGWVAAATVGAAVVGGAVSAYSANKAAGEEESAANNANATIQDQYNSTVARNAPFVTAGTGATSKLADLEGTSGNTGAVGYGSLNAPFTAADYLANQDPGFQFQLQTGEQAIQNQAGTTGSAVGGAALKGLDTFSQGVAATGYQNAFNRYQTQNSNVYSRLAGLAGLGQASANNTGASGAAAAGAESANTVGAGNAAAAGTVGTANAVSSAASTGAGYYYLNSLNPGSTSTGLPASASTSATVTNPGNFDGSLGATG